MEADAQNHGQGAPPAPEVPQHVAIIMDGNGRWARQHGMPRLAGHRAGTENIRRILRALAHHGVRYVTLFAFSTENWGRPQGEVTGLLEILQQVIQEEVEALHHENVRILHLGHRSRLPSSLAQSIDRALKLTKHNTGLTLCVAFDYGGRAEILDAVRQLIQEGTAPEQVTDEALRRRLHLPAVPDPDLIIRTAGEQRLSNFLIWQAAYSEFYCTATLWPDFDDTEVEQALEAYRQRQRRFGRLLAEV